MLLNHPNIVKGLDFQAQDVFYFAMEFIEGVSLDKILEKEGKLSEELATRVMLQIADALKYADEFKIVHRDIKPGNIMMTKEGVPKLCDMGLAKTKNPKEVQLTQPGAILGTPAYMPPEQLESNSNIEIRADIYSLGITFYHLLTGSLPYTGTIEDIIYGHLFYPTPSPKDKVPTVSQQVCDIIQAMTAKETTKRCTPVELIGMLKKLLKPKQEEVGIHKAPAWLQKASKIAVDIPVFQLPILEIQKSQEKDRKELKEVVPELPDWLKKHIEKKSSSQT
jgi:serine/threonine-protein kinase